MPGMAHRPGEAPGPSISPCTSHNHRRSSRHPSNANASCRKRSKPSDPPLVQRRQHADAHSRAVPAPSVSKLRAHGHLLTLVRARDLAVPRTCGVREPDSAGPNSTALWRRTSSANPAGRANSTMRQLLRIQALQQQCRPRSQHGHRSGPATSPVDCDPASSPGRCGPSVPQSQGPPCPRCSTPSSSQSVRWRTCG